MHTIQPTTVILDPTARNFLEQLAQAGGPAIHTLTPQAAREVLASAQSSPILSYQTRVEQRDVPVGSQGSVSLRLVRPLAADSELPVVLYLHGGGWVLGDQHTHERLVGELAVRANVAVAFLNYSRAPEARYPVALEEAYAAASWLADNGSGMGLDGSRIALAGDSAGGNLAAALSLLSPQRAGPKFVGLVLFYPVTSAALDTDSYRQFAEGYFLTRDGMEWFWDQYAPQLEQRREPTLVPLEASLEQLASFPPTLVQTAEFDVLRDEGEAFAARLVQAGVRVTATRYLGIIHDFVMLDALAETPATRAAMAQAVEFLKECLER